MAEIKILTEKIDKRELKRLVEQYFKDMVKYVVDVRQRRIAIGGELHADAGSFCLRAEASKRIYGEPIIIRVKGNQGVLNIPRSLTSGLLQEIAAWKL